jgi:hypothetical protein
MSKCHEQKHASEPQRRSLRKNQKPFVFTYSEHTNMVIVWHFNLKAATRVKVSLPI